MEKSGGRKVMDEIKSFEKAHLFDLGHPLLNRIADSFVKAAGVGALQAVSREAYFMVVEGAGFDSNNVSPPLGVTGNKKHRFPNLRGESSKSLDALVKNTGKESLLWGLAAGLYSGVTYGIQEVRGGAHDWRNSAVAGALTGAAMAMTTSELTLELLIRPKFSNKINEDEDSELTLELLIHISASKETKRLDQN